MSYQLKHKFKIYQYGYKKAKRLSKGNNGNRISEIFKHISNYHYKDVSVEDKLMRKSQQLLSKMNCFQE